MRESRSAAQLAAGASDRGRGAECEAATARDPPLPRPQPMGAETRPEHGAAGRHNVKYSHNEVNVQVNAGCWSNLKADNGQWRAMKCISML